NAVLNTGLQRMYYKMLHDEFGGTLTRDPQDPTRVLSGTTLHARLLDVPLLGFSLGIIAMDDPTSPPHNEFDVRVRTRLRDTADMQPSAPPYKEGLIERVTGAVAGQPNNGVMRMKTNANCGTPPCPPACSVAAKGAFGRAAEPEIIVAFRYLFCT